METAPTYRTNRDLFSNRYLDEHLPETDEWDEVSEGELREAYDDIRDLWEREKSTAPNRDESRLEEQFVRPVFRTLGIPFEVEESTDRSQRRPDYGFFDSEETARTAFDRREEGGDFYENSVAVADARRWGRPLDTRASGEHERDFENPSYRIHLHLQETPTQWAVLTNGTKWRLYYGPTSHRLDAYYEIDLPTVLEKGDLEDFKYFYLFFRHEAFLEDADGDSFLDDVYDESDVFARELGEDLRDDIHEAIETLSEGFLRHPDNDLGEDDLELVHDSSLVYLYRLIFVLYAEAEGRDLLDTDNEIYESYSLNSLKREVPEELDGANPECRDRRDDLWSRLDGLFKLVDQGSVSRGIPEEDLHVPAYNGGLFRTDPDEDDSREAVFLANHEAGDAYLAKVIELLTRNGDTNGGEKTFVDYSSLDVRYLGSIYEELLEYRLNVADEPLTLDDGEYVSADENDDVAVEEGAVYLTTDSGERKTTGSYYTPEYVVEYIVENTLEPLVEDIKLDLAGTRDEFAERFAERVFDLQVLDPAMGSGHFLTSAVDYLAREIIDVQQRQATRRGIETVDEGHDINWARRRVAQRCIYGVDSNPLAVELAKVSLWFRTLAAERPLTFLDHRLKTGNSLVGSDIEGLASEEGDSGRNGSSADFDIARKRTIGQLMRIYRDFVAIENRELADVDGMEAKYDEFGRNELRQRLAAMANVHTADEVGLGDPPEDAYKRMAFALEDDSEWERIERMQWFRDAQSWAEEQNYFHWKLEFPEVFYTTEGRTASHSGFDAIVGNPPYVRIQNLEKSDEAVADYLDRNYNTTHRNYDLAVPFTEAGYELLREEGLFGFIETKKWIQSEYGEQLRAYLAENQAMYELVDFGDRQVFPGASTYTVLLFLQKSERETFRYTEVLDLDGVTDRFGEVRSADEVISDDFYSYVESFDRLDSSPWVFAPPDEREILDHLDEFPVLEEYTDTIFVGLQTSADPVYILEVVDENEETVNAYSKELDKEVELEREVTRPLLRGQDMQKWAVTDYDSRVIFPYRIDTEDGTYEIIPRQTFERQFPKTWDYLEANESRLLDRADVDEGVWWGYPYPKNLEKFESPKLLTQVLANEASLALDESGEFAFVGGGTAGGYGITVDEDTIGYPALLALLNSSLLDWTLKKESSQFRGGYHSYAKRYLQILPVCSGKLGDPITEPTEHRLVDEGDDLEEGLETLTEEVISVVAEKRELDTSLSGYLGDYRWGRELSELSASQPASNVDDTILVDTEEERENLRLDGCSVVDRGAKLTLEVTARYKPEDEDDYETDRWGYTETEFVPAMEFVGMDTQTRELVSEFVPYAIERGEGFANFRSTATKTNSLLDRLGDLTLPKIDDISEGLKRYLRTNETLETLESKQSRAEDVIDDLVYSAYGIDDEQRSIIEKSSKDS